MASIKATALKMSNFHPKILSEWEHMQVYNDVVTKLFLPITKTRKGSDSKDYINITFTPVS